MRTCGRLQAVDAEGGRVHRYDAARVLQRRQLLGDGVQAVEGGRHAQVVVAVQPHGRGREVAVVRHAARLVHDVQRVERHDWGGETKAAIWGRDRELERV